MSNPAQERSRYPDLNSEIQAIRGPQRQYLLGTKIAGLVSLIAGVAYQKFSDCSYYARVYFDKSDPSCFSNSAIGGPGEWLFACSAIFGILCMMSWLTQEGKVEDAIKKHEWRREWEQGR